MPFLFGQAIAGREVSHNGIVGEDVTVNGIRQAPVTGFLLFRLYGLPVSACLVQCLQPGTEGKKVRFHLKISLTDADVQFLGFRGYLQAESLREVRLRLPVLHQVTGSK